MAFKRSAVRSRLSPPTRKSEKRPETLVSGLFCANCGEIENFQFCVNTGKVEWFFSPGTGGTAVLCVESAFLSQGLAHNRFSSVAEVF